MVGYYKKAQICLNGHIVTNDTSNSSLLTNYCKKCGAKTMLSCTDCKEHIHGYYEIQGILHLGSSTNPEAPKYCHNCGEAYPWTKKGIAATKELLVLSEELSNEEKKELKENLNDLISDTPRTKIAVMHVKNIIKKVAPPVAKTIQDVLVDIVSESVKKAIWG